MNRLRSRRGQSGHTLVELMVSITIGIVVLGAMIVVYLSSGSGSKQINSMSRMDEESSIMMAVLGQQFRIAGFSLPRLEVGTASATVNGASLSQPNRNFTGAPLRGCDHGFDDIKVDFDSLSCASASTGPASIAIRYEGIPVPVPASDPFGALIPPYKDCLQQKAPSVSGSLGNPYWLVESRFWVHAGPVNSELYCGGNGATGFSGKGIAELVEDMSFEYGVAKDASSPDAEAYLSAASIDKLGGTADQNWGRVVSIKLCLLMLSQDKLASGAAATYIDCQGNKVSSSDGQLRRAYRSVIAIRNKSGTAIGS